jgi:hypothetical protein
VPEPTATNRVVITELSSDDDGDVSSDGEAENPSVYHATVRATFRPSRPEGDTSFQRSGGTPRRAGRPESIYIDPLNVLDGERLR